MHTQFPCWEEVNLSLIPLTPGVGQNQSRDCFSTENFNEKDMLLAEQECPSFCQVVTAI